MTVRAQMHQDHHQWSMEHAAWQADVQAWRKELNLAREEMGKVEAMLCQHDSTLLEHAQKVRNHEQSVVCHEHTVVEQQRGETPMPMEPGTEIHERERRSEHDLGEDHQRIKLRHHAMMVRLAKMKEWLNKPLE